MAWLSTEADDQSSLHCVTEWTDVVSVHWASRCKPWRWMLKDISIHLQDTCRTAAPELRHGPEVQRTSVQKQTHLLCPFTFQFGLETINCLCHHRIIIQHIPLGHHSMGEEILSNIPLHRHLTSFNECPRVLPDVSIWNISVNGMAEKPWAILQTSTRRPICTEHQ